ncbi:MAG: hypothetical protein ACNA8W_02385 [Bradymonadaceae bacterium]
MGAFELLNRLGILSIGRRPEWKTPASTGIPTSPTAGVSIAGAVKTMVWLECREELHRRTARVTITNDAATTYTVTIGGNAVATGGEATLEATIDAMVEDINTDVDAGALVVASREGAGDDSVLLLRGAGSADYTLTVGAETGSGTIDFTADATTAEVWVYLYADGIGDKPEGWAIAKDGHWGDIGDEIDFRGITERLETAGYSRCAVEVVADGAVQVQIGPGVME